MLIRSASWFDLKRPPSLGSIFFPRSYLYILTQDKCRFKSKREDQKFAESLWEKTTKNTYNKVEKRGLRSKKMGKWNVYPHWKFRVVHDFHHHCPAFFKTKKNEESTKSNKRDAYISKHYTFVIKRCICRRYIYI